MIYVVRIKNGTPSHFKIGFTISKSPYPRMANIQVCCPFEIELVHFLYGSLGHEAAIMGRMKAFHVHGEWFAETEESKKKLKEVIAGLRLEEWEPEFGPGIKKHRILLSKAAKTRPKPYPSVRAPIFSEDW